MSEEMKEIVGEVVERKNDFCVVALETTGEYSVRDIQTSIAWSKNPYPDTYAVVPDEMVPAIMETRGFCDIELNEDGTEVVSFTAREIPDIPAPDPEPTPAGDESVWDELDKAYQEGVDSV